MTHHVPSDILFEYAAGNTPEAVSLFVATHLALCPTCRAEVETYDALGGSFLAKAPGADVGADVLERTMARLDASAPTPVPPPPPLSGDIVIPQPLRSYTGDFANIRWQGVVPGIRQLVLPVQWNGVPVKLSCVRGGIRIPRHTHAAPELHMVLSGGFTDGPDHFVRGDVEFGDVGIYHELAIDRGADCVTLVCTAAKNVNATWFGHIVASILGI